MSKSFIIEAILFTDNLVSSVELIKSISHLKDSKADTYVSSVSPSSKESVCRKTDRDMIILLLKLFHETNLIYNALMDTPVPYLGCLRNIAYKHSRVQSNVLS